MHEALIAGWKRLSKWIDESSEELRLLNQLELAASLWDKRGRRTDDLWSKQALQESDIVLEQAISKGTVNAEFVATSERQIRKARFRLTAIVGILVVALVSSAWVGNHFLRGKLCTGAEEEAAAVWNPQVKEAIGKAFIETGVSYAKDTVDRVNKLLDGYSNEWAAHYTKACEATHVKGDQSYEVLDLRMSCLRKRSKELGALGKVFAKADSGVVQRAVQASSSLSDLSICADKKALRAPYPPPKTDEAKKMVAAIRDELADAEALQKTGKYQKGLELARQIEKDANAVQYLPVQAEVLYRIGKLLEKSGDYKNAEITLHDAIRLAGKCGDSLLVADSITLLVYVVGYRQARYEEGLSLGGIAESVFNINVSNDTLLAPLFNNLGVIYKTIGKLHKALDYYQKALSIREKTLGPDHAVVAYLLNNLGLLFNVQGEFKKARDYLQRALSILNKELGPDHPDVATTLTNLGSVFTRQESFDRALDSFQSALRIYRVGLGANHPQVAYALNKIAELFIHRGDYDKAQEYFNNALVIEENVLGTEHPDVATTLASIGNVRVKKGRYKEALKFFQKALRIYSAGLGSDHPFVVKTLDSIGEVLVAQGKHKDSLEPLEQILGICEKTNCEVDQRGKALFLLARALMATNGDKARVIKLAKQTREIFGKTPKAFKKELEEVNTCLQKHGASKLAKKVSP